MEERDKCVENVFLWLLYMYIKDIYQPEGFYRIVRYAAFEVTAQWTRAQSGIIFLHKICRSDFTA
jgi:hypothetical protein